MIPPQVAIEILGGDSAVATEKVLEALMAAANRLDMEIAAHPLTLAAGQHKGLIGPGDAA